MRTRAAYMKPPWQVECRDVELPDVPPPAWFRLKVEACGICGSDLNGAVGHGDWHSFGHEIAGTVDAVGHGVTDLKPGVRVALESATFCGRCELCRNGRVDLCTKAPAFWGQPAMGFSTYMQAPACCAVPYEGLDAEEACLVEPMGVAFDMLKTAQVRMGQSVCVVGPGPIGLGAAALARHQAAARTMIIGRSHAKARLAVATSLGLEVRSVDGPLGAAKDLHGQFDHVLLTAPPEFIEPSLDLLAYGGTLTYIGIATGDARIGFDANRFHFRKLQLRASFASPALDFPAVIRLMRAGILPARALISHRFGLNAIAEAMATCRNDKANVIKVVVKP